MADSPPGVNRHPFRRHALRIATAILALVIVIAIGWTFAGLLQSPALQARENPVRALRELRILSAKSSRRRSREGGNP